MLNSIVAEKSNHLWGEGWLDLRKKWDLDFSVFQFNHGAYGAVPIEVRQYQRSLLDRIDRNSTGFFRRELLPLLEEARQEAARFCGAKPDNFAWLRNATEGITAALDAVAMQSGDEVVITNHVYSAVKLAVEKKCARSGARIVEAKVPIAADDSEIIEAISRCMSRRTRLLVIDEIASPTARLFPVERIGELARAHDAFLLVDGAHAPGMYPLSLEDLGADLWVGNFHKWVCAPHGAAALWAAPHWHERLSPLSVSFRDGLPYPHNFGRLGTDDLTPVLCVPHAIRFLQEIGAQRIQEYNKELARLGAELIRKALGTEAIEGRFAARHPVRLPGGVASDEDKARQLQTRIGVELNAELSVTEPLSDGEDGTIVISAFLYNHPDEYEQFGLLLDEWLRKKA